MSIRIVVIDGGTSSERDVSLRSGKAVFDALVRDGFDAVEVRLDSDALPTGLDPASDVVFPVLHGGYGEDGGIQGDLEKAGFAYVGCDSTSSRVCMEKPLAKAAAEKAGVRIAKGVVIRDGDSPVASAIVAKLGEELVAKPACEGSSVGLFFPTGEKELAAWLDVPRKGEWIVEQRIRGAELTCGILDGEPMGVVQIAPKSGVYDFKSKYTSGSTEYLFPAPISTEATDRVRSGARAAFAACGCRDFARADFILPSDGVPVFLELNTLPGMTATSLLPKSASCVGLSFDQLVARMAAPAMKRLTSLLK
jgi:D-alanine-D-alanine ligase